MKRWEQIVLLVTLLPACWLAMMAVHELGHVIVAAVTGGTVTKVVLYPLTISRTDVSPNPAPLAVAWAGPILGVLIPLTAWGILAQLRLPGNHVARFFAGFCLVANGCYILIGGFDGVGDAGDIVRLGSPFWLLVLFGLPAVVLGFRLWHGQGKHYGLGNGDQTTLPDSPLTTYWVIAVLLALLLAGFTLSPRQ